MIQYLRVCEKEFECNILLCFVGEAMYYSIRRSLEDENIQFSKVFLWNEILLRTQS